MIADQKLLPLICATRTHMSRELFLIRVHSRNSRLDLAITAMTRDSGDDGDLREIHLSPDYR
jgi:hypothetical protein